MDEKKIEELVAKDRAHAMSKEEREEQRIGFAFGNAPKDDKNTRETITQIAKAQRGLTKAAEG